MLWREDATDISPPQHTEEKIADGVLFKVKYLGSTEVAFDPRFQQKNQAAVRRGPASARRRGAHAPQALASIGVFKPGTGRTAKLCVSNSKITLLSADKGEVGSVIMRHSTSRVAFSTVDNKDPTLFCYIGLVKGTSVALSHIFQCKKPQDGYELTFTCAQAFDSNYRAYKEAEAAAAPCALDSSVLEPTIEPAGAPHAPSPPRGGSSLRPADAGVYLDISAHRSRSPIKSPDGSYAPLVELDDDPFDSAHLAAMEDAGCIQT